MEGRKGEGSVEERQEEGRGGEIEKRIEEKVLYS